MGTMTYANVTGCGGGGIGGVGSVGSPAKEDDC